MVIPSLGLSGGIGLTTRGSVAGDVPAFLDGSKAKGQTVFVQAVEEDRDAILLPGYLREAYLKAEEFCEALGHRMKGAGFLKTLLLRRVGSSIYAGLQTARRMLENWEDATTTAEEEEDDRAVLS